MRLSLLLTVAMTLAGCSLGAGAPEVPWARAELVVEGPLDAERLALRSYALRTACPVDATPEGVLALLAEPGTPLISGSSPTIYAGELDGGSARVGFGFRTEEPNQRFRCVVVIGHTVTNRSTGVERGPDVVLVLHDAPFETRYAYQGAYDEVDLGRVSVAG